MARPSQRGQSLQAFPTNARVGMDHIERARYCRDLDVTNGPTFPDFVAKRVRDRIRHGAQTGTGHVELHALQAVRLNGVQDVHQRGSGKRLGEDPKAHHTAPATSASRTSSPLSADRAMATMARIEATPSSMSAPCKGAPWRIASANPSICSL